MVALSARAVAAGTWLVTGSVCWVCWAAWAAIVVALPPKSVSAEPPPAESSSLALRREEAERAFRAGLDLAREGQCESAVPDFELSFKLFPRPSTLFNLARCLDLLGRLEEAADGYARYLALDSGDLEEQKAVEERIALIEQRIGRLEVTSPVTTEVAHGERVLGETPLEVALSPGDYRLELRPQGYAPLTKGVAIESGQRLRLRLSEEELTPLLAEDAPQLSDTELGEGTVKGPFARRHDAAGGAGRRQVHPAWFWTTASLAFASLAAGAGVALAAGQERRSLADARADADPRLPFEQDTSRLGRLSQSADGLFIAGGALGLTAVVLAIFTPFRASGKATGKGKVSARSPAAQGGASLIRGERFPVLSLSVGGPGLGLQAAGRF